MTCKRERPIIFSGDMVRAILKNRKSQTRRVLKKEKFFKHIPMYYGGPLEYRPCGHSWPGKRIDMMCSDCALKLLIKCPYGQPGDRLWLRETWAMELIAGEGEYPDESESVLIKWKADNLDWVDYGNADIPCDYRFIERKGWRSPLYMPKWAARIWLEITGIRVERVQDISEDDARSEGIYNHEHLKYITSACKAFQGLWDSLNKKRGFGWDDNPWVWVIEFKVLERGKQT
jgi:hypothetical protein